MSADIRSFFSLRQKRTASVSVDTESDQDVETSESYGPKPTTEMQSHLQVHNVEAHCSDAELSTEENADPDSPWPHETDCSRTYSRSTADLSNSGEAQGEVSSNPESECCTGNSLQIPPPGPHLKVVRQKTKGWRVDLVKNHKTYCFCSICCQFPEVCKQ